MNKTTGQRTIDAASVLDSNFIDSKGLFVYRYQQFPNLHVMGGLQGEKAVVAFRKEFAHLIAEEVAYNWYNRKRKCYEFSQSIFVLTNRCIVDLGQRCEILHDGGQPQFLEQCTALMKRFTVKEKRRPQEINLIVRGGNGLELKAMEVNRTRLNLDLFYEDEFREVDEIIQKRLKAKGDKGIVLLHGLPGTGKTTYLRYLIGKIRKPVLFLSPNTAGDLMNPDFIDLLIDNPGTVVVIEDAENIIMDRRTTGSSSVSNLLNISDGLLADFLNVQLICTFNSALTLVDPALLRKGRLIARYEFGKLSVRKAQRLSDHLGFRRTIDRPMTLAEISGQEEKAFESKSVEVIGFRREWAN